MNRATLTFETKEKKNAWLYSFMDLTLLLTTFFIMIFALVKANEEERSGITNSLQEKFSVNKRNLYTGTSNLDYLESLLNKNSLTAKVDSLLNIKHIDNSLHIIIPYDHIFEQDTGLLNAPKALLEFIIASLFNLKKNKVEFLSVIVDNDYSRGKITDIYNNILSWNIKSMHFYNLLLESGASKKIVLGSKYIDQLDFNIPQEEAKIYSNSFRIVIYDDAPHR